MSSQRSSQDGKNVFSYTSEGRRPVPFRTRSKRELTKRAFDISLRNWAAHLTPVKEHGTRSSKKAIGGPSTSTPIPRARTHVDEGPLDPEDDWGIPSPKRKRRSNENLTPETYVQSTSKIAQRSRATRSAHESGRKNKSASRSQKKTGDTGSTLNTSVDRRSSSRHAIPRDPEQAENLESDDSNDYGSDGSNLKRRVSQRDVNQKAVSNVHSLVGNTSARQTKRKMSVSERSVRVHSGRQMEVDESEDEEEAEEEEDEEDEHSDNASPAKTNHPKQRQARPSSSPTGSVSEQEEGSLDQEDDASDMVVERGDSDDEVSQELTERQHKDNASVGQDRGRERSPDVFGTPHMSKTYARTHTPASAAKQPIAGTSRASQRALFQNSSTGARSNASLAHSFGEDAVASETPSGYSQSRDHHSHGRKSGSIARQQEQTSHISPDSSSSSKKQDRSRSSRSGHQGRSQASSSSPESVSREEVQNSSAVPQSNRRRQSPTSSTRSTPRKKNQSTNTMQTPSRKTRQSPISASRSPVSEMTPGRAPHTEVRGESPEDPPSQPSHRRSPSTSTHPHKTPAPMPSPARKSPRISPGVRKENLGTETPQVPMPQTTPLSAFQTAPRTITARALRMESTPLVYRTMIEPHAGPPPSDVSDIASDTPVVRKKNPNVTNVERDSLHAVTPQKSPPSPGRAKAHKSTAHVRAKAQGSPKAVLFWRGPKDKRRNKNELCDLDIVLNHVDTVGKKCRNNEDSFVSQKVIGYVTRRLKEDIQDSLEAIHEVQALKRSVNASARALKEKCRDLFEIQQDEIRLQDDVEAKKKGIDPDRTVVVEDRNFLVQFLQDLAKLNA